MPFIGHGHDLFLNGKQAKKNLSTSSSKLLLHIENALDLQYREYDENPKFRAVNQNADDNDDNTLF